MIDKSILNILDSLKAYAALVGAFLTGFIALGVIDVIPKWLAGVTLFLTWFGTWKVPYLAGDLKVEHTDAPVSDDEEH